MRFEQALDSMSARMRSCAMDQHWLITSVTIITVLSITTSITSINSITSTINVCEVIHGPALV